MIRKFRLYLYTNDTYTQDQIVLWLPYSDEAFDPAIPFNPVPISKTKRLPMLQICDNDFIKFVKKSVRNSKYDFTVYYRIDEGLAYLWKLNPNSNVLRTKNVRQIEKDLAELKRMLELEEDLEKKLPEKTA